jgi:hypothetical protein
LLLAYTAVSVMFSFALVPTLPAAVVPVVATLAGPPALLLWGRQALGLFAFASVLLVVLVYCGLRSRSKAWFVAAVAVWLLSGFLSFAMSA